MINVLKNIIDKKREKVKIYKKEYSENKIFENIKKIKNFTNFKDRLIKRNSNSEISIVAEIKKASPSAGLIVKNYNPVDIAKLYIDNGALFLSVLTEEDFFLGRLEHIRLIKNNYKIPILCKDFIIDTYQISLAKSFGADCILIILSAVDNILAKDLYQASIDLDISVLVEVHSESEAETALSFEKSLIGINNRNLDTLDVSLDTSLKLSKILNSHKNPLICESGIRNSEDIKYIVKNSKIYNFLIGESILKSDDIEAKIKEFTQIIL